MSTKGKRMADNSGKEENISSESYKYGAYERNKEREEENNMRKKKKMNKGLKIFLIILLVLVIIIVGLGVAGYTFVNGKIGKMQKENIDTTAVGINEETKQELKGYRNIALLGIDSRADDYGLGNRSDCMMIASINQETNEIKLISVYRDTYVYVMENGTKRLDKITHAYSYGEAPLAIKTLNTNLDLNIKEFVTVNFDAVKDIIDAVGGISMPVTAEEVPHVPGITAAGTYNLTGEQALAYSRIRHASGGDYKRTERMRDVLTAVANKLKTFNIGQLNNFVDTVLPKVYTNITASDIFSLLPNAVNYKISQSIGWPYETKGITLDRWYGIPVTLESNVTKLHKEVFGQTDYILPDTVKEISDSIVSKTGYKGQ